MSLHQRFRRFYFSPSHCLVTYAEVLQSSQTQDYASSSETVINLGSIKRDLLNSKNSSTISTSPLALCNNTSSPENSSACKCNSLSLESTQDKEILRYFRRITESYVVH